MWIELCCFPRFMWTQSATLQFLPSKPPLIQLRLFCLPAADTRWSKPSHRFPASEVFPSNPFQLTRCPLLLSPTLNPFLEILRQIQRHLINDSSLSMLLRSANRAQGPLTVMDCHDSYTAILVTEAVLHILVTIDWKAVKRKCFLTNTWLTSHACRI